MHKWVRIATAALLPPVAFLESLAWYGCMAVFFIYLSDVLGLGITTAGTAYSIVRLCSMGGILLAGLVAVGIGGHFTLVLGLVTMAAGMAGLALATDTTVWPVIVLLALGVGGYRVGVFAAAARPFGHPRGHLRDALFVGLWASFNAGAMVGPLASSWSASSGIGHRPSLHLLGGVLLLAAILASVLGLLVLRASREPPEPEDSGRRFSGRLLAVAVGIIVVCALPWGAYGIVGMLHTEVVWELEFRVSPELLYAINPAIILLGSLLLVPLLVILHVARVQVPATVPIGVGLVLFGLGLALLAAPLPGDRLIPFLAGTVVMTVGELLLGPFVLSRVAGDLHWRLAPLAIAVWLAASGLLSSLSAWTWAHETARMAVTWTGVGTALLGGIGLLALSWPLRRVFVPDVSSQTPKGAVEADVDRWQVDQFGV